jgi:hypothetical protein
VASIHLDCVCRHEVGNKSQHAFAQVRALVQTPPSRVYPPPMLVRARESAIADYAPPTSIVEKNFSKLVHKQARTRKCAPALRERPGNGDRTWPKQRAPAHAPPRSLCFAMLPPCASFQRMDRNSGQEFLSVARCLKINTNISRIS